MARPPLRLSSSGSFHAGAPILRYHTFPLQPDSPSPPTPLPWKQLGLLALVALAEQTALNSISPYLPTMVAAFDLPPAQIGLYVGFLASAFALAQLATNLLWGWLSDRVGRKPVMLLGTTCLAVCFVFFGLCRTFGQLLAVHVAMGLLNGNAAVVPTCLGEVTDRSNQSRAFIWLPVMYSIGSVSGPALGGLLVSRGEHPFLLPNLVAAVLLFASVVVLAFFFDETLEGVPGLEWVWCAPKSRSWVSRWPTRQQRILHDDDHEDDDDDDDDDDADNSEREPLKNTLFDRTTVTVLATYLVFQLSNISFNSLYPIFATAPLPTGRGLGPNVIGLSLSFAGLATMLFQVFTFQPLKARLGNLGTYRVAVLGIAVSMALMPWVGTRPDMWLYAELGFVLVVKNISAVGGLSSVMLLINNSAPSHDTLGTLNGMAQTLSAAGRSVGPFLSGALFTLSTHVRPKGEVLAWGLFAGITMLGWLGTLSIRRDGLESGDWVGEAGEAGESTPGEEEDA